MNNIYIPFPTEQNSIGGPQTFMRNLQKGLNKLDYHYNSSTNNADGMFFPISADLKKIKSIKKQGGKIIQRLDGIFYPSKHGKKFIKQNKSIKKIYCDLADYIIFQSDYSKQQVFTMFGEKDTADYSLICNGADTDIFFPDQNLSSIERSDIIKFITTGNFRNPDMLDPVITAMDMLKTKGYNFELEVIGPITTPARDYILAKEYIKNYKTTSQNTIAEALRKSHIYIYSHLNPPCPNSVIEAIASGLPVVGFDSGSMRELCHFNSDLLAYVSDEIFQKYQDFEPVKLFDKLELAINNFSSYKTIAIAHCQEYTLEKCIAGYIKIFDSIQPDFTLKPGFFRKFFPGK